MAGGTRGRTRGRPTDGTPRPCPCGRPATYDECCGRFHRGAATAPTAVLLMRSRYSAFAVGDANYLRRTWAAEHRPVRLDLDPRMRWTGLDVLAVTGGSAFHQEGKVEFRAHYVLDGEPGELHERSRFVREDGSWVYLDDRA